MANQNIPLGFKVIDSRRWMTLQFPVAASFDGESGDDVYCDSAGRATTTAGVTLGIQKGLPRDVSAGGKAVVDTPAGTTCSAGDLISVYFELGLIFTGQSSSGALADKYTTRSSGASFDAAGNQGQRYIDTAASSTDSIKIVNAWHEPDTGAESAVGSYQKVVASWNPSVHMIGTTA